MNLYRAVAKSLILAVSLIAMGFSGVPSSAQSTEQNEQLKRQLDLLNEALKRPEGETAQERRERVYDYGAQQNREREADRARQHDYEQARTKRLLNDISGINHGPVSEYDRKREERLRAATPDVQSQPDQRTAGFSQEALGDSWGGASSSPTDYNYDDDDIDSYSRRGEDLKDAETAPPVERHYCKCKNGDKLDMSGFMCIQYDRTGKTVDQYPSGNYPYTPQCVRDHRSYDEPGSDFTQ